MVCTLGRGRMAAMARLLAAGNFPETTKEELNDEKIAAQAIYKELHEANEANLLEEEDMHVFDFMPLTDPLHLVCCNACKKPIKASQFAAHADRCRSLNSKEDIVLGLDGGTGHKKPPRKGRKKLQTSHDDQVATIGEHEKLEPKDGDDTAASEPNMDGLTGNCREAKRTSISMDSTPVMEGSGVSTRSTNYSDNVMAPSKRRTKIAAEPLPPADCLETKHGVTTEMRINCQEALTCREFSRRPVAGRVNPSDAAIGYQKAGQVLGHDLSTAGHLLTDVPLPLATKMYHSQRSRLRTALGHLYHVALAKEHENNHLTQKLVHGNSMLSSQISSPDNLLHETQKDDMLQKEDNNFLRPALSVDTAPMERMRSRYLPTPYSFPGNSGTTLGTVQKPDGSVSVT
ncbi:SCA7 domain-containing protein SELMODRAFT_431321-like isoform X3 [Magnolia sinica]|uniref:SCA7 domain-containing protein SELMODRAFT_431321-like isoform X3 n=1 Tax=Magnolia sinica TaxID=86752 RepID=UPI002658CD94|nr:SCA7 domain-containing protein SELMODRAFT_431321-like isoform X3 [Magnolia sinica]